MTELDKEIRRSMPLVNQVVSLLERWRLRCQTVSILAIATGLHVLPGEIIRIFQLFGIQPVAWNLPSDYEVAAIIDTLTAHEVAARYGKVKR